MKPPRASAKEWEPGAPPNFSGLQRGTILKNLAFDPTDFMSGSREPGRKKINPHWGETPENIFQKKRFSKAFPNKNGHGEPGGEGLPLVYCDWNQGFFLFQNSNGDWGENFDQTQAVTTDPARQKKQRFCDFSGGGLGFDECGGNGWGNF